MGFQGLAGFGGGLGYLAFSGAADTSYHSKRSTRFNHNLSTIEEDSAYLNRTPSSEGNRRTWTYNTWIKANDVQSWLLSAKESGAHYTHLGFDGNGSAYFHNRQSSGSNITDNFTSDARHRDFSAWAMVTYVWDTTNSTESERFRIYYNGERLTGNNNYPAENQLGFINTTNVHSIGYDVDNNQYFDVQLADVHFLDGLALDPTSFGEPDATTGQWVPKEYTHSTSDWHTLNDGTTWSDYVSASSGYAASPSNAFDGSTSNRCEPSDNSTVTFDFTGLPGGGIDVSNSLRIYLAKAGNPAASHFTVNGTNLGGSLPSGDWLPVSTSLLETITLYHQSGASSVELFAIEVDGKILVDHTAIGYDSSGQKNHWHENNLVADVGKVYSETSTWSYSGNGFGSNPPSKVFDSDLTNYMNNNAGGQTITWDSSSFELSGALRLYCYGGSYTVSVCRSGGFEPFLSRFGL